MTFDEEQKILATITAESAKLMKLKETFDIEAKQVKNTDNNPDSVAPDVPDKIRDEKNDKLEHELMVKREAEEKRHLLQAVIREAEESGFPMPPSLIKLLNHTNGEIESFFLCFSS